MAGARPTRTGVKSSRARPSPKRAPKARTKPARTPTGAQALVAQLEALGVEVIFGIPGVHNLAIFDALRASSIRTVLVRHEQTAAYAADGYARATGRLGVCVTTTGPGAANTAAAMGEARASRSPLLHISTQIASELLEGRGGRFSLHESPHQRALMDTVSTWSGTVARPEAIPSMVQRGAQEAFVGRRGPVFLEIPHDYLDAPVSWKPKALSTRTLAPDMRSLERAAKVLRDAKQPIIWVGGGAVSSGADGVLRKMSEVLDAPVVSTFAGKGLMPPQHPLWVGFPPHQPEVSKLIESSDAILIVGSDLDGMNTQGWRLALPRPRVSINTLAQDARRNYASDVIIEGDALRTLEMLLPMLAVRAEGAGAKRAARARTAAERALARSKEFAKPYAFVRAVESALPPDVMVVADMAIGGYWMAAYHRAAAPRSFAYPLGWGTLGFALPAAVGAAATGRPTLAVLGDAGLMFAPGELATAVQERLPLVVLCVNDEGYGMLRFDERERFGAEFASDLHTPDLVAMAKSFGAKARRCEPDDIATALRWAFKQGCPVLVEVRARFAPPLTTSPRWPLAGKPPARP